MPLHPALSRLSEWLMRPSVVFVLRMLQRLHLAVFYSNAKFPEVALVRFGRGVVVLCWVAPLRGVSRYCPGPVVTGAQL